MCCSHNNFVIIDIDTIIFQNFILNLFRNVAWVGNYSLNKRPRYKEWKEKQDQAAAADEG